MVEWDIEEDPVQNTYVVSVSIPPSIEATSSRVEKREGEDVELSCVAQGTPTPSIQWRKLSGEQWPMQHGSILHLSNLSRKDTGQYLCEASNGAGKNATDTVMLQVQCKHYE